MSDQKTSQNESFSDLYETAKQDIVGMGPFARVVCALVVIVVLFKMTPILDLLYVAIQVVVLPLMFLVAWGIVSKESYQFFIGWLNDLIEWGRKEKNKQAVQNTPIDTSTEG